MVPYHPKNCASETFLMYLYAGVRGSDVQRPASEQLPASENCCLCSSGALFTLTCTVYERVHIKVIKIITNVIKSEHT